MILKKIKIISFFLLFGIFGFFVYSEITKYEVNEKEQKIQNDVSEINRTELPKSIHGVKKKTAMPDSALLTGDENSDFSDEDSVRSDTTDSFYINETHVVDEDVEKHIKADGIKPKIVIPNLPDDLQIVDKIISWGHYTPNQARTIDTIIVHSVYDALGNDIHSVDGVIYEFELYAVGAHYIIARDGAIYRLVSDKDIAYHAGVSKMPDNRTNVNDFSIGIELLYHKDEIPNEIQYQKLANLVKNLKSKHKIDYILGHADIAPSRKTDPWNFDWQKFNEIFKF